MPELPEVETIRRDLEPRLVGRRFTRVQITPDRVPVVKGLDETTFRERLVGSRVEAVTRRGKFLAFQLEEQRWGQVGKGADAAVRSIPGAYLVLHLRMTGALLHRRPDSPPDPYVRAVLSLEDGSELRFSDLRKFGGLWLVNALSDAIDGLGPEPLSADFTPGTLAAALDGRRAAVKSVILDQRRVAGIGNIYADEALFEAGIDPRRHGATLAVVEVDALHAAIRSVLAAGVESRGASFRDYLDADGRAGSMQMYVRVFRRTGKPCYRCATPIERVKVGGRGTHFCPRCQR